MFERDETVYVRHMLDAIHRIERYVRDADPSRFAKDEMLQDAVVRQLEILGEAAGRVSRESCSRHPAIPWPKITGLRHRLIHDYFEVDLNLVWRVVTVDLIEVTPHVEAMLRSLLDD
jgi:uncharacterized protein with HEPN domain